jgi:hypothetical protein
MVRKTEYANALAAYERVVATNPKVTRKGATMPYTSVNGHMFSLLTKEGALALRLPEKERDEFLAKHRTTLCKQYGTVMKEYVVVPDAVLKNTRAMKKYFDISFTYASGLKAKPTTGARATKGRA